MAWEKRDKLSLKASEPHLYGWMQAVTACLPLLNYFVAVSFLQVYVEIKEKIHPIQL